MTARPSALISLSATVAAVLRRCPDAIVVFTRHHMACPGCAFAPYDTLADAADAYGIERGGLLAEVLRCCARRGGLSPDTRARSTGGAGSRGQSGRGARR